MRLATIRVAALMTILLLAVGISAGVTVDINGPYTPAASTVGLWHLDGTTDDAVGPAPHGNHPGTLHNGAQFAEGKFGQGLLFDGENDYMRLGNVHTNPSLPVAQGTVEAWVKMTANDTYFTILGSGREYGGRWDDGFFLGRHWAYGHTLMFGIWGSGWHYAHSDIDPADLVGQWHHLAGTWGPEGVELWVDGERVATNSWTHGLPNPNYDTALVGSDSWQWNTPCVVDEVRISSAQLDFTNADVIPEPLTASAFFVSLAAVGRYIRRRT